MRLIDADALIDEIKYIAGQDTIMWFDDRKIRREQEVNMAAFIERMPTIDTVKRGKWLPHPTEIDWNVCSVCGIGTHTRFHYNEGVYGGYDVEESFWYCPHCGARME